MDRHVDRHVDARCIVMWIIRWMLWSQTGVGLVYGGDHVHGDGDGVGLRHGSISC